MGFLSDDQLKDMGFASLGEGVQISDKASIYNPAAISIGSHSRIDDFCILSAGEGGITIGRHVHIACFCSLIGQAPIVFEDFAGISSRVSIYSSSDDYSGVVMTNPTIPEEFRKVISAPVIFRKHALVGCGAIIMPGVELGEGCVLGAMSLALRNLEPFCTYFGSPAKKIFKRKRDLLAAEEEFKKKYWHPNM